MELLLDTHLLLWVVVSTHKLPNAARQLLDDEKSDLVFSVASIWEVAIKRSRGREDFQG